MSKSLRLAAAAAVAFGCFALGAGSAAAQDSCPVTTPEENMDIVVAYEEAFDEAHFENMDLHLHDDHVENGNRFTLEHEVGHNEDEHQVAVMLETLYPGSVQHIDEIFAFDDKVVIVTRLEVSQHTLTPDGQPAMLETPAEMMGVALFTIECGQIIHAHVSTDLFGLMTQLGFELAPAM